MGCNCNKSRVSGANGGTATSGTYVVTVNSRQVYESSNLDAAKTVAGRFQSAEIIGPDGSVVP
jgi:hypothetical protein